MALTAIQRMRIAQAILALRRYNKEPYMVDFVKSQPKPTIPIYRYDRWELADLIKRILLGQPERRESRYKIKLEDLIAHLDKLQETGRQHIYLFRLPELELEEALKWLGARDKVKQRLGGEDQIYKGGRLVWETNDAPELALVRYEPAGSTAAGSLLLKWVQTRRYWVPQTSEEAIEFAEITSESQPQRIAAVGTTEAEEIIDDEEAEEPDEGSSPVPKPVNNGVSKLVKVTVRLQERAATFLVIDLGNGHCELRVQGLQGSSRLKRQRQLDTYRALMTQFCGFEPVGPTVLAPAIRRALITRDVNILSCEAILPEGGQFIGGKDEFPPVDVRKLGAGLATGFTWRTRRSSARQDEPGGLDKPAGRDEPVGRVTLDGRLDEIFVARPLLPTQHWALLNQIGRWREEGLADLSSPVTKKTAQPKTGAAIQDSRGIAKTNQTLQQGSHSGEPAATPAGRDGKPTSAQARKAIAILGAALKSGVEPERPGVQPGIDSAIREYTETHASEAGPHVAAAGQRRKRTRSSTRRAVSADELPLDQFLSYIREVASSERANFEREITIVRNEEKWNSRLNIAAAILALATFITGIIFFTFGSSKLTIGSITALLGALTGRGTWLIHSYGKSLKAKRSLIHDQQRDSQQTLTMIQMALAIPDRKGRSKTMRDVAKQLLQRLTRPVPAPPAPSAPVPKPAKTGASF